MPDHLVTLNTFPSFGQACQVVRQLTAAGVYAVVTDKHDLMGFGWFRVQVRETDLERAAAALTGTDGPPDEGPEATDPIEDGFAAKLKALADRAEADRDIAAFYPPAPAVVPPDLT